MPTETYAEIPLTQGQVAIIDSDDYGRVAQHKWHARWSAQMGCFYAARKIRMQVIWPMQNFVLGILPGSQYEGDHIDQARTLDNRTKNLRIATRSQQAAHRRVKRTSKLGFKGVWPMSGRPDSIQAGIRVDGKHIHLGTFRKAELEKAALAYDAAARLYHGDFAQLNFPGRHL